MRAPARRKLAIHPRPARQKARAPLQSGRCARLPLYPPLEHVQGAQGGRRGKAPRALAPESARVLPKVRVISLAY